MDTVSKKDTQVSTAAANYKAIKTAPLAMTPKATQRKAKPDKQGRPLTNIVIK